MRPGPPSTAAVKLLCNLLENYPPPRDPSHEYLAVILALDGIDLRLPARLALAALKKLPPLRDALAIARAEGFAAAAAWALSSQGQPLIGDDLLRLALRAGPNTDPAIELLLSEIRRALALDPILLAEPLRAAFAEIVANQCALNEYVWAIGPGEMAHYDHPVVRRLYPTPELALKSAAAYADATSRDVAQHYEDHPYPSWTHINIPAEGIQLAQIRALQAEAGLAEMPSAPHVLIAGCGTGQQAVQMAAGFGRGASLLACDLSAASLAYAKRKAVEHRFNNIEFRQADILTLGTLGLHFDIIACTGVLHHMQDPFLGWRTLTDLLVPGGVQYIALYSATARKSLDEIRLRFPPDETLPMNARIREFRRRVVETYAFVWPASGIDWIDFFTLGGCRDLLFHAHETRYTIARIAEELEHLGLQFLGFVVPSSVGHDFAAAFPNPAAQRDLAAWDSFERAHPQTFSRMYQFWCAKKPN